MHDPIADMLIRIKNAAESGKSSLVVPFSNIKAAISEVLEKEGFIKSYSRRGKKVNKLIEIELLYEADGRQSRPKIQGVKRASKFSRRLYTKAREIWPIRQGYGVTILSTPKGIMTGENAKKENVGGEVLFYIW